MSRDPDLSAFDLEVSDVKRLEISADQTAVELELHCAVRNWRYRQWLLRMAERLRMDSRHFDPVDYCVSLNFVGVRFLEATAFQSGIHVPGVPHIEGWENLDDFRITKNSDSGYWAFIDIEGSILKFAYDLCIQRQRGLEIER